MPVRERSAVEKVGIDAGGAAEMAFAAFADCPPNHTTVTTPTNMAMRTAIHGLVLLAFIRSTPVFRFLKFEAGLLADHVFDVNVVLLADVFVRLHTGVKQDIPASGPGLRVRPRVIKRGLVVKNQFIHARKTLGHVELFRVRMPGRVNPASIIKPCDINYQSISLPVADALAQISWIQLIRRRMFAPVHVHHSPHVRAALEDKQDAVRELIDLEWEGGRILTRNAGRQTESLGVVLRDVRIALFVDGFGPGEKSNVDLPFRLGRP